jgi:hypothetical protein
MISFHTPRAHAVCRAALFALLALASTRAVLAQQGSGTPAPTQTVAPVIAPAPVVAPTAQAGTVDANGNMQPAGSVLPATTAPAARTATAALPPTTAVRPPFPLAPEKAQPLRVPRFETPPTIDGKLDDAVWRTAAVFSEFYQIGPGDNIAPSMPTEAYIGYDAHFLYFAFHCYDDPTKVRATVARRDNVFGEDNMRVYLDTFNDKRKAYIFGWNPLGVQQDGITNEGGSTDYSVDIVMESKGTLTADGYTIEVAIPFKSLRYEAGKDKPWGIHVWRNIDRFNDEVDSWMPISRDNSGLLNQEGHITGLEGVSTERTIELIPSLTVSETGKRARSYIPGGPERFVNQPIELDAGLTAKFGVSPTMTLDLALNPDFAQVEADQLVVTTNQRFPIFYPERRPFFLEGIEIFQTPITAVHTRAIVDPDAAVKLTGRRGPNTYGVMLASDNGPGNFTLDDRDNLTASYQQCLSRNKLTPGVCADPHRLFDKNAYIGVLRLKRNVGRENSVGLIATSYNFIEKHNQLFGLDGRFRLDPKTTITFQTLGSTARNFFRDADLGSTNYRTGNGLAYSLDATRQGRNFTAEFYGEGYTKDYRADVGFVGRTNTNFNSLFLGWNSTPKPKARLVSWNAHNFTHIDYDFQRRMQIWESEFAGQLALQGNMYVGGGNEYAYERLFEEEFGPHRQAAHDGVPFRPGAFAGNDDERSSAKNHYFLNGNWRPSKKYGFASNFVYRDGHFDLDFGGGRRFPRVSPAAVAQRAAQAAGLCRITEEQPVLPSGCLTPALDPGPGGLIQLSVSLAYQPTNALRSTLDYTKNRLRRYDTDLVAFDVNNFSWRTTYQFTRFMFARARLDYETLPRRLRGQFLFGYTPSPGTALYIGYNDDANISGFSSLTGQLQPGFRRNGRTFFIKMSYLFRKSFG